MKTRNQNKEVNDLSRRLNDIETDSHKRRTYLKFLEHKVFSRFEKANRLLDYYLTYL